MLSGVNLLPEKKYRASIFIEFLQKQWKKLKEKPELSEYIEKFEESINELSEEEETSEPYKYYSFIANLEEYKKCIRGLEISIYNEKPETLLFDWSGKKIFKIEDTTYKELMDFSTVKHCRLKYRPVLIQDEKVRFQIDFMLVNENNRIVLKLSSTVSCYDDDRRSYEDQLSPYVKTGETIARTGGWSFYKSCSDTF